MIVNRRNQKPVPEFVAGINTALKGDNVAADIRNSVAVLLKRYGIQTPAQK